MPDESPDRRKELPRLVDGSLARDEQTWAALEAKLKTLRVRRSRGADDTEPPRDC